tara:strand:+ start:5502 stop:6917 length:1416 start_codon:yes stop_codon:yes gene_type:complete
MMATFVRTHDLSVAILDVEVEDLSPEQTAERISRMNPELTAVVVYGHQPSASTQNMTVAEEICTAVKQLAPEHKTLMVGGHVAAVPERTVRETDATFVAGGEGPYTVLELLQALKSGCSDYSKVRGLWYRDGQAVRSTPPAPLVQDLEREIPVPAWDLLEMGKYRAHNWHCFGDLQRQPYASIYTTLGCPYHCSFCCIQAPFKTGEGVLGVKDSVNTYRFWSPDSILDQIDLLVQKYGVRNLRISDEMFVLNTKHVHGICDRIIERGYDLNIWAYARVDTIRGDDTVEKLKRAGFNWLCFGIESASELVRDDVDKNYNQGQIVQSVEKVQAAGINVLGNYIFGLPEDNLEAMQSTLDLAIDLNCEYANFYSAMAYPGSKLYDLAVQNDWPLPENWTGYSQHSVDTLPLPTNHISGPEVLRFRDHAWRVYFNNPGYLDMVDQKFGPETVRHIQEMASHKLERNYIPSATCKD